MAKSMFSKDNEKNDTKQQTEKNKVAAIRQTVDEIMALSRQALSDIADLEKMLKAQETTSTQSVTPKKGNS